MKIQKEVSLKYEKEITLLKKEKTNETSGLEAKDREICHLTEKLKIHESYKRDNDLIIKDLRLIINKLQEENERVKKEEGQLQEQNYQMMSAGSQLQIEVEKHKKVNLKFITDIEGLTKKNETLEAQKE